MNLLTGSGLSGNILDHGGHHLALGLISLMGTTCVSLGGSRITCVAGKCHLSPGVDHVTTTDPEVASGHVTPGEPEVGVCHVIPTEPEGRDGSRDCHRTGSGAGLHESRRTGSGGGSRDPAKQEVGPQAPSWCTADATLTRCLMSLVGTPCIGRGVSRVWWDSVICPLGRVM